MYQHARWARFADGADEVHMMRIAQRTIASYKDTGSVRKAVGDLPISADQIFDRARHVPEPAVGFGAR